MTALHAILPTLALTAIIALAIGIRVWNFRADERTVRRLIAPRGEILSIRPELTATDVGAGAPDTVTRYRVCYRTPQGQTRQALVLLTFLRHRILTDEPATPPNTPGPKVLPTPRNTSC
jgi:hypothetical protein